MIPRKCVTEIISEIVTESDEAGKCLYPYIADKKKISELRTGCDLIQTKQSKIVCALFHPLCLVQNKFYSLHTST